MMMSRRVVALACACLCAFSASAARKEPMPMPVAPQLAVEVFNGQHEVAVDVDVKATYATGVVLGGVVGGLIAHEIAGNRIEAAQTLAVPLREVLRDYDFERSAVAALRRGLVSDGLSPSIQVVQMERPWQVLEGDAARALPARAMVITPRYSIDEDFTALKVTLQVEVLDRKVKRNGRPKGEPVFTRTYAFSSRIDGTDRERNLQQWVSLGREDLVLLVELGLQQVVEMMVFDFSPGGRAQWDMGVPSRPVNIGGELVHGVLRVHETDTFVWLRSGYKWENFEGLQRIDVQAYRAARAARTRAAATGSAAPAPVTTEPAAAASAAPATP